MTILPRIFLLLLLVLTSSSAKDELKEEMQLPKGKIVIDGSVLNTDLTPMLYDGNGTITIATKSYGQVFITIPARSSRTGSDVKKGDAIEVSGIVVGDKQIIVRGDDGQYVRIIRERP